MFVNKYVRRSLQIRERQVVRSFTYLRLKYIASKYFAIRTNGERTAAVMESIGDQSPVLKVGQGLIRGSKRTTIYEHQYYGFEGIPYGQPPVGDLRFKSPLPAKSWEGVRDCRESDIKPLQKNFQGEIEGSEDCLYLNVYAKTLTSKEKLPVLVWIYGGAFNTGSCVRPKYGPDYFMQEDVILVTLNYRLSVFGFLSFRDPSLQIPGNAGLKDQILALKWVRDNISVFGGDQDNVTLFGESAGAASVHYMMCTEHTKGLFHKAICMSGCILNNWAWTAEGTELPYRLACNKGYSGPKDDQSVFKFLQNRPGHELLHMDELNRGACANGGFFAFLPSTEVYNNGDAVVTKPLLDMLKTSWSNEIPLMIGGTSFEGLLRYPTIKQNPDMIKTCKEIPEMMMPSEVLVGQSEDCKKELLGKLLKLHFKDTDATEQENMMNFMDYFTFRAFWHDFHRVVKSRKLLSTAPTYQYLFDFDSPTFNHHRKMFCGSDIQTGVAHADDLAYIFYSFYSWKLDQNTKEYLTIRRMIQMWTQFAKTSNPNCEYTKESVWKTVAETSDDEWLRISDNMKFEKMPDEFRNKLEVWNSIYGDRLL